ncbi:MAG: 50S ribosomal protein L11 methyltransferase [Desulfohalobiaceae bacterium]
MKFHTSEAPLGPAPEEQARLSAGSGALCGASGPPEELFIYYLRGLVDDRALRQRDDFLGNWLEGKSSFLFFSRPVSRAVSELLRSQPGLELIQEHRVPYTDWLGDELTTFREGSIRVVPVWEEPGTDPETTDILLNPGVVFGAGNHPTTRGCLREMERVFAQEKVETVLDLGSGTGLLSLAAAGMGASRVVGMDSNPLAARTMRGNILQNGLRDRVLAACGYAKGVVAERADLVLANIHYDAMREIVSGSDILRAGRAILAGLFPTQAEEIAAMLRDRGMRVSVEPGLEWEWPVVSAVGAKPVAAAEHHDRAGIIADKDGAFP